MMSGLRERARAADFQIGVASLIFGFIGAAALVLSGNATIGMSWIIFVRIDLFGFLVAGLIALFSASSYARMPKPFFNSGLLRFPKVSPLWVALVALVMMIGLVGPVYHDFAFSMDEYMTRFQAEIFAAGRLAGEVPPPWRELGRALHNSFARFDAMSGQVYSQYRPGMAALYAFFDLAGIGLYTSAILSAGSIVLVASVARRLWPQSDTAPLFAALIVATSQQVFFTGLTSYAMSAHLFFNLLWLRLFLLDRPWAHVLAAIVGVATSALHQVHVQVFFAAPFLLSLLRPFRFRLLLWYGTAYALGLFAIIGWDKVALGAAVTGASDGGMVETGRGFAERVARIFRLPGSFEFSTVAALLVRFVAWQNLALVPLLVIAARRAEWSRPMQLLAASIVLSLMPYVFLMPDQGHGWGYRYLHGLIGNFALLATAGCLAVEKMEPSGRRRTTASLLALGVLSVVILLPLRVVQVESLVAPFARAYDEILTSAADVVVVDTPSIIYGQDLVRNRPFLENRPVLVDLRHLNSAGAKRICAAHPHSVKVVGADDLLRFGLWIERIPFRPPIDRELILSELRAQGCAAR